MTEARVMAPSNIKINPIGIAVIAAVTVVILYAGSSMRIFRSEDKVNLKELLSVGIDVARKGGERVRVIRESSNMDEQSKGLTQEGAKELMTNGDIQSHVQMYYGIKNSFPTVEVKSEEHDPKGIDTKSVPKANKYLTEIQSLDATVEVPVKDITIWIDPLDATQEYTENLRQYVTTMVCVAIKGVPTIGIIYKPFLDKTYWGFVGHGHSANLVTPETFTSDKTKIIVSRSHSGQVEQVAKSAMGDAIEIIPAGGAGFKTLEVISGNASAYVHVTRIKKWDLCAGNAIINSIDVDHKDGVEGKMTTLEGRLIDYSGAGSPINDDGLLATIHEHEKFLTILKPAFESMKKEQTG